MPTFIPGRRPGEFGSATASGGGLLQLITKALPAVQGELQERARVRRAQPFLDESLKQQQAATTTAQAKAGVAEETAQLGVTAAKTEVDRLALELGIQSEAVMQSLFDENTQKPIRDPGRANTIFGLIKQGKPLPPNVSLQGDVLSAATGAGMADDIPGFLAGQKTLREEQVSQAKASTRAAEATAAGTELANLFNANGLSVLDSTTGQSVPLTPEQATKIATNPFDPSVQVVLPTQLESQITDTANAFFNGDTDAARDYLTLTMLTLPLETAQLGLQEKQANISYLTALSEQASSTVLKNLLAGNGTALKPNELRQIAKGITDASNDAYAHILGARLTSLVGKEIDPTTKQPIVGFFRNLAGLDPKATEQNIPTSQQALTIADLDGLLQTGLTDDPRSATDLPTIQNALMTLLSSKGVDITDIESGEFAFPILDSAGLPTDVIQPIAFQEMIQRIAQGRVSFQERNTLIGLAVGRASAARPTTPAPTTAPPAAAPTNGETPVDAPTTGPLEDFLQKNLTDVENLRRTP